MSRFFRLTLTLGKFGTVEGSLDRQLTIVMISMHTSPLAQPGQGDAGGLNVYIRNLMQALIHAGHQVLAFTRKTAVTDETVVLDQKTESKVIPLAVGRLSLPKEVLSELTSQFTDELTARVEEHAQHTIVLHSHYWLSGMVAHQAALSLHAPVIHTMHTLGATKNSSVPGTESNYRIEREAYIGAHSEVIVANTPVEKQELVEHTGVDPERVQVVHPGVDHNIFQPSGPDWWPGRTPGAAPKILFAGRIQHYKGPHVLLQALAVLRDRGFRTIPVIHFTGAASGDPGYDLRAMAHLLGVAQYVSFSPPVAAETLAQYMRSADVVAIPSISESFGFVAVESQACGTPVLAHRVGGLPIAVADEVSGEFVDSLHANAWADALASVVSHPSRWIRYGAAGFAHSSQFSWSAMAERMVEIYCSAVSVAT